MEKRVYSIPLLGELEHLHYSKSVRRLVLLEFSVVVFCSSLLGVDKVVAGACAGVAALSISSGPS